MVTAGYVFWNSAIIHAIYMLKPSESVLFKDCKTLGIFVFSKSLLFGTLSHQVRQASIPGVNIMSMFHYHMDLVYCTMDGIGNIIKTKSCCYEKISISIWLKVISSTLSTNGTLRPLVSAVE